VKVAQRWRFQDKPERVWAQGTAAILPGASVRDLGHQLKSKGYQVRGACTHPRPQLRLNCGRRPGRRNLMVHP
jgi:hypothetical protein